MSDFSILAQVFGRANRDTGQTPELRSVHTTAYHPHTLETTVAGKTTGLCITMINGKDKQDLVLIQAFHRMNGSHVTIYRGPLDQLMKLDGIIDKARLLLGNDP